MKMANNLIIVGIVLIGTITPALAGTITVTTTPAFLTASGEQYVLINKDDAASTGVGFSATETHTNGTVSAWQWYFRNGSPLSSTAGGSGTSNPGTVTFSNADGQNNACTAGVTHTGSSPGNESCASSSTVVSTVDVVIPKITIANGTGTSSSDIWYFTNGTGTCEPPYFYPINATVSLIGVTASEAGSITWAVGGQHAINFDNGSSTKTSSNLTETITSSDGSTSENNVWITATLHSVSIKSASFTVRTPAIVGSPTSSTSYPTSPPNGYVTTWTYPVGDAFNHLTVPGLAFCEVLDHPAAWINDYPGGNNWLAPTYQNGYVFSNSNAIDIYEQPDGTGLIPRTSTTDSTLVCHNGQAYYVGGSGTAGYASTGFVVGNYTVNKKRNEGDH